MSMVGVKLQFLDKRDVDEFLQLVVARAPGGVDKVEAVDDLVAITLI